MQGCFLSRRCGSDLAAVRLHSFAESNLTWEI